MTVFFSCGYKKARVAHSKCVKFYYYFFSVLLLPGLERERGAKNVIRNIWFYFFP